MGLIALVAIAIYAWVTIVVTGATILSTIRCRRVPLYWFVVAIAVAVVPVVINQPLPTKSGSDYGAFSYFLDGAFSWFNVVCFSGGIVSLLVSLIPDETFRVVSALSWGFASAFTVRAFLLLNS